MGKCCQSCANHDVNFEQVDMKIPKKHCDTLERYGQGAAARRETKNMITNYIKQITSLQAPSYPEDGAENIEMNGPVLMTDQELARWINSEQGGKNLKWSNYFIEISDTAQNLDASIVKSSKKYKGHWRNDENKNWEGLGIICFADGSEYQGQTKNEQYNGKGRMTHVNGDIYQGDWKDGKANGFGIFVDTNGSMYEGEWLDDQQHGHGTESWNFKKIKYTGNFVDGKKTGNGRFEFEGGYYEGEFKDGKFDGRGVYYFSDSGKIYDGEFKENNMDGKGLMVWPDQSRYEGDFKMGKIEGHGNKEFANGNRYVGMWKNDQQHGSGVWYSIKDQTKRQGNWQNGKRYSWINPAQSTQVTAFTARQSLVSSQNNSPSQHDRSKISAIQQRGIPSVSSMQL